MILSVSHPDMHFLSPQGEYVDPQQTGIPGRQFNYVKSGKKRLEKECFFVVPCRGSELI